MPSTEAVASEAGGAAYPVGKRGVVAYYVHGRGKGHASRVPAVLRALAARGLAPAFYASEATAAFLKGQELGALALREPLLPGPAAPLRLVSRALSDAAHLRSSRPAMVISDGDQASIVAARLIGVPSLAVGHDQVFRAGVAPDGLPLGSLYYQRLNGAPTQLATRAVAVHFLPLQSSDPRVIVARPEPEWSPAADESARGRTLCYLRDGGGDALLRALQRGGGEVLYFGPQASNVPGVRSHGIETTAFRAALEACECVVASAGSNLLAECVLRRKPLLAVYHPRDAEQRLNALMASRAGVALASPLPTAPKVAGDFLRRVAARDFSTVNLETALPPLSDAVAQVLSAMVP